MNLHQLATKIFEIIPDAVFDEDLDGQLVIYTGLMVDDDDTSPDQEKLVLFRIKDENEDE